MIAEESKRLIRKNITKTLTVAIIGVLAKKYLLKIDYIEFNNEWLINTFATIIGFSIHDLFVYKLNYLVNFKDKTKVIAVRDVLSFGTMLISKEIILSFIHNESININKLFPIGLTLVAYIIYDLYISEKIKPTMDSNTRWVSTFENTLKSVIAFLISDFIPDQDIEVYNLPQLFSLLIAVPLFNAVTGPFVMNRVVFHA
jgi:hypothetical protein